MNIQECRPGISVWARCGSFGWSAARIDRPGRTWITVDFVGKASDGSERLKRCGRRLPTSLVAREPSKDGKDKPTPADAQRIQHEEASS